MIQNNILVNNNSNNSLRFFTSLCNTEGLLQPSWGTGPATFSRASAQYITAFDGETRKVESGSVAVEGSRVVTNLLTYSEDLSNAAWVKGSTCTVTGTNVVNLPAELDYAYQAVTLSSSIGMGFKGSVLLSGTGTVTIRVRNGENNSDSTDKTITLSSAPTRYVVGNTNNSIQSSVRTYIIRLVGNTATSVTVHNAQLENVTGQTNQNPGEYVRTTSSALSQCFSTTNGNTVDASGVVTEVIGTSLPQSYPERVNTNTYGLNDRIQVAGWWYQCTTLGISAGSAPTFPQGKAGTQTVTDGSVVWTIGGRLLLGYVSEPVSTNKVTAYGIIPADTLGSELSSGSLTIGQKYQITARTDADFTADGAADNVVGTQFVATAATVTLDAGDKVKRVQWGVGEKSFHNGSSFVQNITGLTLSGDTAAVLSIITDQTEIEKAGLAGINPGYKVYKLDNSAGSGTATVAVSGTTGNTNAHSIRVTARKQAGSGSSVLQLLSGTGATSISGSVYSKIVSANLTPSGTTQTLNVVAGIGDTLYFLLPQLEELPYATSVMPTAGATATRAATSLSYPTAGNLRGNDVTVGIEWFPTAIQAADAQFYAGVDSGNAFGLFSTKSDYRFRKVISDTETTAQKFVTPTILTRHTLIGRLSKVAGVSIFVDGLAPANNTNKSDGITGTTFTVGTRGASGITPATVNGYLRNLRIYWKALSDDRCKQLTL